MDTEKILKEVIESLSQEDDFKRLLTQDNFEFELNKQIWEEFKNFEPKINKLQFYNDILSKVKKDIKLKDFVDLFEENSDERIFACLCGSVIRSFDIKAPTKEIGFKYDNQNIMGVAGAGLNIGLWLKYLIAYKKDGITNNTNNILKNAIKYIESPETNLNWLSEKKRREFYKIIFNKEYNESNFTNDFFLLFDKLNLEIKNLENKGTIYSDILSLLIKNINSKNKIDLCKSFIEQIRNSQISCWFYKPGDKAHIWKECYKENLMRFGYDRYMNELFNSNDFSENKILEVVKEINEENKNPDATKRIINNFLNVCQPNDILFACDGNLKIIGMGTVEEGEIYFDVNEEYENYKTIRPADWKIDLSKNPIILNKDVNLSKQVTPPTIEKCFNDDAIKILQYLIHGKLNVTEHTDNHYFPLNIILYGPPGTGKTYSHKKIISIIENNDNLSEINNQNYDSSVFETIKSQDRFNFITFHQSYSYEEFIEGLRPDNDGTFNPKPGLLKEFSERARNYIKSPEKSILIENAIKKFIEELDNDEYVELNTKTNKKFKVRYKNGATFIINPEDSINKETSHHASIEGIKKLYIFNDEGSTNISYVWGILEYLKRKYINSDKTAIQNIKGRNFYLLIDEINRGNISKIFGELITLIEEDKRDCYHIPLLYSKELFTLPPNLFIIGTMNTADRSIALIDTALRRRFHFIEIMSNPDLIQPLIIENVEIKLNELLKAMNKRIEYLFDRDHIIGHAYLLTVKNFEDLSFVFRHKIFPLLQEYFYNDWEKISQILNDNGFIVKNENVQKDKLFSKFSNDIDDKIIYEIDEESFKSLDSYLKIYD